MNKTTKEVYDLFRVIIILIVSVATFVVMGIYISHEFGFINLLLILGISLIMAIGIMKFKYKKKVKKK